MGAEGFQVVHGGVEDEVDVSLRGALQAFEDVGQGAGSHADAGFAPAAGERGEFQESAGDLLDGGGIFLGGACEGGEAAGEVAELGGGAVLEVRVQGQHNVPFAGRFRRGDKARFMPFVRSGGFAWK
jgi:hypothetical protein